MEMFRNGWIDLGKIHKCPWTKMLQPYKIREMEVRSPWMPFFTYLVSTSPAVKWWVRP